MQRQIFSFRLEKLALLPFGSSIIVALMKVPEFPKVPFLAVIFGFLVAQPSITLADTQQRTIVVRERGTASLLNATFTFKVLKIKGYTIDVKVAGKKQVLKIGQSISPTSAECSVTFEEIATETRIARFTTNCW